MQYSEDLAADLCSACRNVFMGQFRISTLIKGNSC